MDPSLSTSDAHLLFGKLYRKSRPPELQKKVEDIVSSTTDVFVRIKKIEDIDAQLKEDSRGVETRAPQKRSRGRGSSSGNSKSGKKSTVRKKTKAKKADGGGGFFARIFGNEISRWGVRTSTLEGGLFSRNPVLSEKIFKLFKVLSDAQIRSTVAAFKGLLGTAWEQFEPARYNVLIAAYQFIVEFVKTDGIIRKAANVEDLSTSTIRLQKSYAMMINFPDYEKILLNDFVKLVSNSPDLSSESSVIQNTLKILVNIDERSPGLQDSILAMYVVTRKKLVSWDEVCRELKVGIPQIKEYRAPEQVMEVIQKKIRALKNDYKQNNIEVDEAKKIKETYLETDSKGKLKVDFLTPIVSDVMRRLFKEQNLSSDFINSYKKEPHKLLYCIIKDLELNIVFLFSNTVMTKGEGQHSEEVFVFKTGFFARTQARFIEVLRDAEQFMKSNKDMAYPFADYLQDLRTPPESAERLAFINLSREVLKIFGKIVADLQRIVSNHDSAVELENFGKATEVQLSTKAVPIDSIDAKPRFIPYSEREIFASSRMNGLTVGHLIKDYVKNIYNYLYIFRDPELISSLGSATSKVKENERLKEELQRMGATLDTSS